MNTCLFCKAKEFFTRPEHIIPEGLGNDDLLLRDEVCDKCNQYFGSKVEQFVLQKTPLAFWRAFLGIKSKSGTLPRAELSQPKIEKGRLPSTHPLHDNVGFTYHDDGSASADIHDDRLVREILEGKRRQFQFVFTPLVLSMMGRLFCKVGMELLCLQDPCLARSDIFEQARTFARYGAPRLLWAIGHKHMGDIRDIRAMRPDSDGLFEEVLCYEYQLLSAEEHDLFLFLRIGTDGWIVSLNDPFPSSLLGGGFIDASAQVLWYPPDTL